MTILAAFYKTIVDSPNPNQTQEFDYEASLCSLEKTFKKFNPIGKTFDVKISYAFGHSLLGEIQFEKELVLL